MNGEYNAMVIPQQLEAWGASGDYGDGKGAYLSVYCRISNVIDPEKGATPDNLKQLFPETADTYGYSAVPIDTEWKPGYKYIYTLEFCGKNGGGGQEEPDTPDPGEPVLGGPIKLMVDVIPWKDVPEDIPMGPVEPENP